MAEKDITEKTLESYNDVFADIVNVLLFNGNKIITPDSLIDVAPFSMYKTDGNIHEQDRDVAKYWENNNIQIAFYGFENQTKIDKDMPLRIISYDGSAYRHQLNLKKNLADDEKRFPVITLVLYFGQSPWDNYLTLLERLHVPEQLKPFVSDYKLNVFNISQLTLEQVELFQSDFKVVAEYFVQNRLFKDYVPSKKTIKHVDEILKLMSLLTQDTRFEDKINDFSGRSDVNMCEILDKIEAKGEARATRKTRLEDIHNLMHNLNLTAKQAMEALNMSENDQAEYMPQI